MTLTDTGPLVSLVDRNDANHAHCRDLLPALLAPLIVTWPCFTEAMYLLGKTGGWTFQKQLWSFVFRKALHLYAHSDTEVNRIPVLMEQYRDTPMDLADASVVSAAETLGVRRVFTLDHPFRIYRINNTDGFEIVI